jgi:tetratricopeptide (TPR) repeat protein
LILALLAIASPSAGQVRFPRGPAQAPVPQWSAVDQAVGKEEYLEAKKQADAILQRGTPEDRQKTMLVYGRILLGLGQADQARQYLNMLSKSGAAVGAKMAIYGAWLKAIDNKKSDEAIKSLEKMLQQAGGAPDETTAEAADVLAMLYMARGEQENAKKAVDFGLKCLQYHGIKSGYVLTLLRGRLNSDFTAGEAKQLYNKAEKLRQEGKFVEAAQLFAQVVAAYPKNPWGHASGFRIGQCYVGLGRISQAMDWWQKFIKQSPAGPWRGQAHVAMVDLVLETQLDLKKATEHAMAATTVLAKGPDNDAEPSWKEAAYDIYLRQGIVSLVDGRFDAAVEGFQQAKQSAPKGTSSEVQAGLDRLIESAQNRVKLLPDELTIGDDRATVALVLGNIYSVLRQYDLAKGWFSLPLNGSLRSHSAGHRSFAGLGLAGAVIASGQPISSSKSPGAQPSPLLQAKAICEASLAEYPKGSWHDETLFRLATVIQDLAETKFGKSPSATADAKKPSQPAKLPGSHERNGKAEREQLVSFVKARAEALPHWQEIIRRFPKSPRCEQAFYNAGVLLYNLADDVPGEKSEQMAMDADSLFNRLCEAYPKSPYIGDACVRQIDFALERKYDLKLATALSEQGLRWAKNQDVQVVTTADGTLTRASVEDAAKAIQNASAKLPDWVEPGAKPAESFLEDLSNLYLRAGIMAYFQEKYDEASQYFDAAGPARPTEGMHAAFDLQKFGLFILKECAKRKEPSWYPDAINVAKTESQKLALKLADTYLHAQRPEKAVVIYGQLLAGDSLLGRPSTAVKAYCMMQLALAYSNDAVNYDKSIEYYRRFLGKEYADLPWAADALMRLAVLEYNTSHDPRRAIPQFQYIISHYPKHPDAERAMYFLALAAVHLGDKALAESSCKAFIEKYPRSGWKDHVQSVLNNDVPKLQDQGKGREQ